MFGQIEILPLFTIHSDQFLGRTENCCRGGLVEICYLVASIVHEQGYLRVKREIVPFPGGAGGGEIKVVQVEGEGNGHQIGIRGRTSCSGENGERLVAAELLQDIREFSGSGHCRLHTSMKWTGRIVRQNNTLFQSETGKKTV